MPLDFSKVTARLDAAMPDALRAGMQVIADASSPQVPIETGALLASQEVGADDAQAWLAYWASYAIFVHEILSNNHPHGNAKFLEIPLIAEGFAALERVAEVLSRAL
jgi:hypothetical protein